MKNHMTQENYKAILVPMGKEGWSEGDILKCTSFDNISAEEKDLNAIAIAKSDNPYAALCWQAQKLIIVNTKAEIKEEDWIFDSDYKSVEKAVRTPESKQDPNYILCSKIISSYPPLPNITPLPLQFVQDYVNRGEGCRVKVEMEPCCEVNCTGECVSNKSNWKHNLNNDGTLAISAVREEKSDILSEVVQMAKSRPEEEKKESFEGFMKIAGESFLQMWFMLGCENEMCATLEHEGEKYFLSFVPANKIPFYAKHTPVPASASTDSEEVEGLATAYYESISNRTNWNWKEVVEQSFKAGYNAKNGFSEEDIKVAFLSGQERMWNYNGPTGRGEWVNKYSDFNEWLNDFKKENK